MVELVDHRSGTDWVVDRLAELTARHLPAAVVLDGAGPAGALLVDLQRRRLPLVVLGTTDVARACAGLVDALAAGRLVHLDAPDLDDAVANAARMYVGDAFKWRRRTIAADLSPLYAATLARYGAATAPGAPIVRAS